MLSIYRTMGCVFGMNGQRLNKLLDLVAPKASLVLSMVISGAIMVPVKNQMAATTKMGWIKSLR